MALFKLHKGTGSFPTKAVEGYAYFNTNTGRFAIDTESSTTNGDSHRKLINPDTIVDITRDGTTFTATRVDNSTFTFTQQDNENLLELAADERVIKNSSF